ncbi:hypothetical protein Taro_034975 [Colocasia esculenta]|uniref:Cleavage stimulation factor 50 kDa subunit n=1 Tax=Colocasia esculenta TaxID=4460 RepID=A0A843VXT7_COLES|nr:hypothetical protein [Colocasia esculenta]
MDSGLEQALQEGKLLRQVNALIIAHLREHSHHQAGAAASVASATSTPLSSVEAPPNRLIDLVAKGLAVERGGALRASPFDITSSVRGSYGLGSAPSGAVDFSVVQDAKSSSKGFPKHETRHISEHKNVARCARFSPDGRFVATGSADTSIKLFEVSKIKQMMLPEARDGPVRPVIRTFYDHVQPISDLDFHPQSNILISGAKDHTIKFFDFSKTVARRAFRVIQDTHNVRSVSFHPSGEFLLAGILTSCFPNLISKMLMLQIDNAVCFSPIFTQEDFLIGMHIAGTDHSLPHLYDINTFQCYLSADLPDLNPNAAINQVRYSSTGAMYVTASKDGAIRIWDGVTAQCVRFISQAHGSSEATSVRFTKDERFVLSCGKDSTVKLWEVATGRLVKQYLGAVHMQLRCQAVFNGTEEFVLSIDEASNEVIVWDAVSAEKVAKWPSNHAGAPRWIEHSPTEEAFITCGTDRSVRFWKEIL